MGLVALLAARLDAEKTETGGPRVPCVRWG